MLCGNKTLAIADSKNKLKINLGKGICHLNDFHLKVAPTEPELTFASLYKQVAPAELGTLRSRNSLLHLFINRWLLRSLALYGAGTHFCISL